MDLPDPQIEPGSPALQVDSLPTEVSGKPQDMHLWSIKFMTKEARIYTGERIGYSLQYSWASLVAQLVKNLPAMREDWI